jgi:hypothetical protein
MATPPAVIELAVACPHAVGCPHVGGSTCKVCKREEAVNCSSKFAQMICGLAMDHCLLAGKIRRSYSALLAKLSKHKSVNDVEKSVLLN